MGDPLFSIYSPELIAAQQEYLVALDAKKKAEESKSAEMLQSAEQLVMATRHHLLLWDMTEKQIDDLAKKAEPSTVVWFSAPVSGFIVGDDVTKGKYVKAGETVLKITDLSTVWLDAEIYEYELPYVSAGDKVEITLSAYPGETFEGKITYIFPNVNPTTRTIKVRAELANPDYKLKMDMYANVTLKKELGKKVAIPVSAVMDTGKRQIAFVDKGDGFFEPREVKLGGKVEDYYEVLGGVSEGETVVTSANFLIDSESQLKAALSGMGEGHQHQK